MDFRLDSACTNSSQILTRRHESRGTRTDSDDYSGYCDARDDVFRYQRYSCSYMVTTAGDGSNDDRVESGGDSDVIDGVRDDLQ